ncbi:ZIP family metal transporter [Candidatus Solirubrobacter pratensis]|uniref:ZIP family metal transporter n=1 Tax=Candidatus Solirubrobacter pratensis TaxID=1298857 RepID=UPI000407C9E1|nr:ZIP family metal transporter [Candidatus Solirubrobacter pratensis]
MSFAETAGLGAIAGFTIFLGLPIGRAEGLSTRVRVGLSMLSAGILAFLFMDVGAEGLGIVESHLDAFKSHEATLWPVVGLFALLSVGFLAGVGGIASVQRRLAGPRREPPRIAGGESAAVMSQAELAEHRRAFADVDARALRTAMVIAAAIGLHNFAEGLAIGVSAHAGEIGLATVLIIGFALHNSTEGFGIVGPLSGVRPSWRWLALAGVVAGGPTFLGAMVGYQVTSDALELCFFALAGGAILYVIGEIWSGVRRQGHTELGLYMLGVGFLLGIATDLVVAYGGA